MAADTSSTSDILLDSSDTSVKGTQFIGFPSEIDWLQLTWEERIIKGVGPLKKHGLTWQYYSDWGLYNFPFSYIQQARGHDRTEKHAWWMLLWGLTVDHGQGYAAGTDRDNARLFRDAAKWQVRRHPHLFGDYKVYNYDITNTKTGTVIRVLSSDDASNYGLTPDLLLVNDFHSWANEDFWNALWTSMGKRTESRMWIESNALALGRDNIQWIRPMRQLARDSYEKYVAEKNSANGFRIQIPTGQKPWFYYRPNSPGFLASWQFHMLDSWKKTMLPHAFRRLIDNEDTSEGDQYLSEEQVTECEVWDKPIPMPERNTRLSKMKHGHINVAIAVDQGYTKDASVCAVVSHEKLDNDKDRFTLHHLDVWTGSRDSPVDMEAVVRQADEYQTKYNAELKICDPWEMRDTMKRDPSWLEFKFNGSSLTKITEYLYHAFAQKRMRIWKDAAPEWQNKGGGKPSRWNLKRELTEAVLKDTSYGTRIDHKSAGFTDRIMAIGMCVVSLLDEEIYPTKKRDIRTHSVGQIPINASFLKRFRQKKSGIIC